VNSIDLLECFFLFHSFISTAPVLSYHMNLIRHPLRLYSVMPSPKTICSDADIVVKLPGSEKEVLTLALSGLPPDNLSFK
jgi:hypothetical protein